MGLISSSQNIFKLICWVDIIAGLLVPLLILVVLVTVSTIVIIQVVHFGSLVSLVEALIAAQMLLLVSI